MDLLLPCHKAEATAQFHQNVLEVREDGGLQLGLTQFHIIRQGKKLKNHRILDENRRNQGLGSFWQRSVGHFLPFASGVLVGCGKQTFIRLSGDLTIQFACSPATGNTFIHIPCARSGIHYAHEDAIMRPAQFVTQCVTNRKGKVELSHIPEICCGVSAAIFCR